MELNESVEIESFSGRFPTFRIYGPGGQKGLHLNRLIGGQYLENRMTVSQGIPAIRAQAGQ